MQIYTAEMALQQEDAAIFSGIRPVGGKSPSANGTLCDEGSIAHFCAFVDFYTRHCDDPMSTSLACEKQAEGVEIRQHDVNAETIQMLLNTVLEVIDHLEKKWLDEQIQLEDRKQRHREDVARLYQQVDLLRQAVAKHTPLYRRGLIRRGFLWFKHLLQRKSSRPKKARSKSSRRRHAIRKEPVASESDALTKLAA